MVTMAMIQIFRNEELKRMDWKMVLQVCVCVRARVQGVMNVVGGAELVLCT